MLDTKLREVLIFGVVLKRRFFFFTRPFTTSSYFDIRHQFFNTFTAVAGISQGGASPLTAEIEINRKSKQKMENGHTAVTSSARTGFIYVLRTVQVCIFFFPNTLDLSVE